MAKRSSTRLREIGAPPRSSRPPTGDSIDEDGPVALPVFIMTALLGFLVVVILGVVFGVRTVQDNLESDALALLAVNGQDALEVEASGTDLHVSGAVDDETLVARIPEFLAANLEGVGDVTADLRVVVTNEARDIVVPAEPLVVRWTSTAASVAGTVSDDLTLASITDALENVFPRVDAAGLAVDEGVAPERDWLPTVLTLVRVVHELTPSGEVLANPNAALVSVAAEFDSRQARTDARTAIEDVLSAITFDFVSALTVKDAEPPPPEQQVIELQESLDDLIEGKVIEFELDSDVITPAGREFLDEILLALGRFPAVPVEISGHTDDRGSDAYNLDLSRRRAEAVLAYLVAQGEDASRFAVVGYGETRPIADNETAEGRARNRRIEFTAVKE